MVQSCNKSGGCLILALIIYKNGFDLLLSIKSVIVPISFIRKADFNGIIIDYWYYNMVYIPESFNANTSHQLFDYAITFVNLQHYNTNSKRVFFTQKPVLKISDIQK